MADVKLKEKILAYLYEIYRLNKCWHGVCQIITEYKRLVCITHGTLLYSVSCSSFGDKVISGL